MTGRASNKLKRILLATATEKGFEVARREAKEEHVRLFVSAWPFISIPVLPKRSKGISAGLFLQAYPGLKKQLSRGHLWNPGYSVGSVGDMSEDVVRKYPEAQKSEASEKALADGSQHGLCLSSGGHPKAK